MTKKETPDISALDDHQKLYQDLVETSQDLIWQCDAEGRYTYLNPAWETTFGYKLNEMLGRKFSDFQTPETAKHDIEEFKRLMQGNMVKGLETIHLGKGGNEIHLIFNAKFVLNDNGKIVGTRGTAQEITDRKEAEVALQESELTFRKLFEDSSDAILLIDETGVFVKCNQAALDLLKMTREQFLFLTPANISPKFQPNGRKSEEAALVMIDLAYQKGLHRFDWTCINTLGGEFIVEVSLMPISIKGKTMLHTTWRDITERKIAEEALRESEARLNSILSSMNDIVFDLDINDCFEGYFAPKNKTLYVQPKLFVGQRFDKILPEDVCVLLRQAIDSIKSGKAYHQFEYHLTIDSVIQWEHAVITPRYNNSDEYVGVTAVCRNITERKLAEESLCRSEANYRDIVENAPMGIFRRNLEGEFQYVNPGVIRQFECTTEKEYLNSYGLLSQRWVHPEKYDEFKALLLKNRKVYGFENEVRLVGGKTKWFALYSFIDDSDQIVNGFSLDITERKHAEDELENSKKSYEEIFNSSTDCIFIHDSKTGEIVEVNQATIETFGYSKEEIRELNVGDFSLNEPPYTQKEAVAFIHQTVTEGPQSFDWRVKKKSGELLWFANILKYVELAGEKRVLAVCRNITERKMIEEELRKSEEKYKTITETSPIGIWEITQDRRTLYVNSAAISLLELDSEKDITEREIDSFFTPESLEVMKAEHSKREQGLQSSYELELVGSRGGRRNVVVSGAPLYSGEGKLTSLIGWFTDITERKQMEKKLQIEKDNFEVVFESSPIGVLILDEATNILRANATAIGLCGGEESLVTHYRPGDALHCANSFEAGCGNGPACPLCPFRRGIEKLIAGTGGTINKAEIQLSVTRDKKEQTLWLEVSAAEMLLGNQRAFIVLLNDITENKTYQEQLIQTQKLESLGLLAGGIAHDFNNLLGGIYGYIDLAGEIAEEDQLKQYLAKSMATIDRARDLSRQLITFAKGGAPVRSIGHLFPFIRETVQFALSGSNVSCKFDIQSDLWLCDFDKNQIGQVIDNIAINAKQAMPDGGTLEVSARNVTLSTDQYATLKAGRYVNVAIKDSGIGMTKEILRRIFDPFFTTKATGHGLGLATCYSIVKRHGGAIEVVSELGKGSTFHVFLPVAIGTIAEPMDKQPKAFKGSGTFVVMDDEEVLRDVTSNMLESLGYSVVCSKNGQAAIEFFEKESKEKHQIAGAILDLTVPGGMGGKEAIRKLKEISPKTIFFAASGHAEDPIMSSPHEFGFRASISKPFRKSELTEMISKHMMIK